MGGALSCVSVPIIFLSPPVGHYVGELQKERDNFLDTRTQAWKRVVNYRSDLETRAFWIRTSRQHWIPVCHVRDPRQAADKHRRTAILSLPNGVDLFWNQHSAIKDAYAVLPDPSLFLNRVWSLPFMCLPHAKPLSATQCCLPETSAPPDSLLW